MRRKDRERIETEFMDEVFQKAEDMAIAFMNGDYPYCLMVNFAKTGNSLYIHCAREGMKLDLIRKNPHVAFTMACDVKIDREKYTTYYKSVCGTGIASIVEDIQEKCQALELIGRRYNSLCPEPDSKMAARVAIIRVDIQQLHGKESRGKG